MSVTPAHVLSRHRGSWAASAPASGLQVIDRLIHACSCLWPHVLKDAGEEERGRDWTQACTDVAFVAGCALASPCPVELVEDRVALMRTWRRQLARLMLAPGIEQRTEAWYEARTQLTTASDVAAAIGGRNGSTKEFLVKKAGGPDEQRPFSGSAPPLKWGIMFEPVANAIYSRRMHVRVHEFGLLRHPTIPHIGASPDGITEMGVMLEIKCPFSRIIDGTVPSAYVAQIQCQLDVCGLDECDFFECQFEETTGIREEDGDDGCERGVLVEHWSDVTKAHVYHYCPEIGGVSSDEVSAREGWAAAVVERLEALPGEVKPVIRRWRLRRLDTVRVHRDPAYVASMNASLAVVWQRVLRYRADRDAYRAEVLLGGSGARRCAAPALQAPVLQGYAFVDDNDGA